jgi:hypothetical protein
MLPISLKITEVKVPKNNLINQFYPIMIAELSHLSKPEQEIVYKAPLLVSILIAGADGSIDRREIHEGFQLMVKKSRSGSSAVAALFKEISQDFEDKLKLLMQQYPYEHTRRNLLISEDIARLNEVMQKLDNRFAIELYKSLLLLAETVAKASGGFLGIKKIAEEEQRFISLPMLHNPARQSH